MEKSKADERKGHPPKPALAAGDAKLLSFAYSASGVSWNRFCNLWLLKSGFSPREVGAMKSLSLAGKLLAQPLWAGSADVGSPPRVLAVSVAASAASLELLRRGTRQGFLARHAKGGHQSFRFVAALRVMRSTSSAASPVADAMVLALASESGQSWGRQRFWGSASWGLGSLAAGALIDRAGLELGLFGSCHLCSLALLLLIALRLLPAWPRESRGGDEEAQTGTPSRSKKRTPRNLGAVVSHGLVALKRSAPLRLALATAVAHGTAVVVVESVLYMQLESELGVSRTMNGMATAVATASSFPFFWHARAATEALGHWRVLCWAQAVLPLRLVLLAAVDGGNVAWLLPLAQVLHGPMFAPWLSAAVELVDALAPPELRASTQALLTMAYFTVGGCIGHLVWSAVFEAWGGRGTYLLAACCSAAATVAFAFAAAPHARASDRAKMPRPWEVRVDDEVVLPSPGPRSRRSSQDQP
mmetsp:Transcript_24860/g.74570  ORF Transcript_24860/g.74570 Transcript_24860/m.74570 type:complete len:473 (+) Transcript_24860:108-1526(+)